MAKVCKEVCTECKCTVQEREIECPAEDLCEIGGEKPSVSPQEKSSVPPPEAKVSCSEKYLELANCLSACLMEKAEKNKAAGEKAAAPKK